MLKRNNVSSTRDNLLFLMIYLSFIFFVNILDLSIVSLLVVYFVAYILFLVYSIKSLKSIKKIFLSAEVIFCTVFFAYAVPAAIMYVLDDYTPRIWYFSINNYTIFETLKIYFNINVIFIILIILTGGIHTMDFYTKEKDYDRKIFIGYDIFDLIALIITIYFFYLHFRNGFSIFSLYFQDLRKLILSDLYNFNTYLYLYMIPYSYVNLYKIIYKNREVKKKITYKELTVAIIMLSFWGLSLLTDRRNFINLLLMVVLVYFYKLRKINLKKLFTLFICCIFVLSISFFRSGTQKKDINNIIFLSTGEFILVNYVTNYYINNHDNLKYGSTYIWDVLTVFIPRSIYPEKPVLLSEQFKEEANTNVAYAFNPVAEGIVNFGPVGATLFVPLLLLLFVKIAYKLSKKHFLYYIIVCGESINFFRGVFSVSVFSITAMVIFTMIMLNKKNKKYKDYLEVNV